jgi:hypothetical protein
VVAVDLDLGLLFEGQLDDEVLPPFDFVLNNNNKTSPASL